MKDQVSMISRPFLLCLGLLLISFMPFFFSWWANISRGIMMGLIFYFMILEAIDSVHLFFLGGIQDILTHTTFGLHIFPLLVLECYVMWQHYPIKGYGFNTMVIHFVIASFLSYGSMWLLALTLFQGHIFLWLHCMQWITAVVMYILCYPIFAFEKGLWYGH